MSDKNNDKTKSGQIGEISDEQIKELTVHFDNMRKLANIGNHFLLFIIRCRMIKANPKDLFELFRKAAADEDPKYANIPVLRLFDWIENPSEENYTSLAKSMNINIDDLVEEILSSSTADGTKKSGPIPLDKKKKSSDKNE